MPPEDTAVADATVTQDASAAATKTDAAETTDQTSAADVGTADATATKPDTNAASVVPDKYELKLPEGSPLPAAFLEKTAARAREWELPNDAAQELVEVSNEAVVTYLAEAETAFKAKQTEWVEANKKDAEFGGDKFVEHSELAKRAVLHFAGTKEEAAALQEALDGTGYGNYTPLWKMMVRIGKAIAEDSHFAGGGGPRQQATTDEQVAENYYAGMKKA